MQNYAQRKNQQDSACAITHYPADLPFENSLVAVLAVILDTSNRHIRPLVVTAINSGAKSIEILNILIPWVIGKKQTLKK